MSYEYCGRDLRMSCDPESWLRNIIPSVVQDSVRELEAALQTAAGGSTGAHREPREQAGMLDQFCARHSDTDLRIIAFGQSIARFPASLVKAVRRRVCHTAHAPQTSRDGLLLRHIAGLAQGDSQISGEIVKFVPRSERSLGSSSSHDHPGAYIQ